MTDNNSKSTQQIWPIFVIAILLGMLGFGLALKSTPETLPTRAVENVEFELPAFEKAIAPVELTKKYDSRKYKVLIEQEGALSPNQNRSRFSFTIVEEKKSDKKFHQTFENAAIEIFSDKNEITPPISFDVARLIQTTKYEVKIDERGERSSTLISSDPGKLRSVLRLIESSLALVHTNPPTALTHDAKWDFKSDGFEGTRSLAGQNKKVLAIRQRVSQPTTPEKVKARISGSGISVHSKADGQLEAAKLTIQSVVELDDKKHASSTQIILKAIQ